MCLLGYNAGFWGNWSSPTIGNELVPVGPLLFLQYPVFGL